MSKLNRDILYLIFKELQHDKKTLYSCLLVNKFWCEIIVPILWKNPWKTFWKNLKVEKKKSQFNVIISHLSNEIKENLKSQGIKLSVIKQKPLFNYINFCKHLDLGVLERIISDNINIEEPKKSIIKNVIYKLFINENIKFSHLYVCCKLIPQIHLIPGYRRCFSELEFLSCNSYTKVNVLAGLAEISLPFLQVLHAKTVSIKVLTSLIESTSGYLIEIKIDYISHEEIDNKRIIQAIYQKCPNLKYLKLLFRNSNISEIENLLVNCQYLKGLFIIVGERFCWDDLFKILTKSSSTSLFKFKFWFYYRNIFELKSLKLFFDNWKGRHPMLLQTLPSENVDMEIYYNLIEEYEAKGIVKKYDNGDNFEEFEWIQKKY